ncbi:MAG: hypothetical protein GTO03_06980 [Planctomycetales bacterium]|nr:hypothetical protein [Planctomycetales bacterium]
MLASPLLGVDTELAGQASWRVFTPDEIRQQLDDWLVKQGAAPPILRQAALVWEPGPSSRTPVTIERIAAVIALVEPRAQPLIKACEAGATPVVAAEAGWLADEGLAPLARNNLRLLLGRSLVQNAYFDEALDQIGELAIEDVLDRGSLLFYQAVAHHRLLHKERGLAALALLLENKQVIPRRHAVLAGLMRADLAQIKDGSLDDISRRMQDVERRLGLGRVNQRVRNIEDKVIEMLDKLIKEEEAKQAQSEAAASGGAQSSQPMPDSRPAAGKGPGQVTKRDIGRTAGWGELPAKQREQAMQEIGRDFPAHYREVIEEYFRELAKQRR